MITFPARLRVIFHCIAIALECEKGSCQLCPEPPQIVVFELSLFGDRAPLVHTASDCYKVGGHKLKMLSRDCPCISMNAFLTHSQLQIWCYG